jgi:hypothetical protein
MHSQLFNSIKLCSTLMFGLSSEPVQTEQQSGNLVCQNYSCHILERDPWHGHAADLANTLRAKSNLLQMLPMTMTSTLLD